MTRTKKRNLITRSEVQQLLQVSGVTLSKYTKSGRITFYRVGRRVLFDREEILNEIRNSKTA
jgi:excisionase family DNA binding protein